MGSRRWRRRALTRGWIVSTSSRLTRRCTSAVTRCATRTSTRFISIRPPTSRQVPSIRNWRPMHKHSLSPCACVLQANFEMQQSELERQTEELAGFLERDVKDIQRTEVVHCFQMAKKRLVTLFEIVDMGEEKNGKNDNGQGSSSTG